ncbi:hypothetical protein AC579_4572 [Pseudocercospora musae]|uniref:Copper acquisition factor BIM1-like domain-containing protein n=1 Tax=Pseudocercospora musae TaxID=113226 RepID=A0A139IU17_9PEZI|nr:hypothetical protein AC579_4572 [Pseudocercospora musae]
MTSPMSSFLAITAFLLSLTSAHMVLTYPGSRGNNLHTNGTPPAFNPDTVGIDYYSNGTRGFPWGMQWMHPCGGMPLTHNRSLWPVTGGAISVQPGWFPGHKKALFYINIGISSPGEFSPPPHYMNNLVQAFQIIGPTNTVYMAQFCLPDVRIPADLGLNKGDNVTIQVIETAQHGASLYTCVDVTLTDAEEVVPVTPQNCYNTSNLAFRTLYTAPIPHDHMQGYD